ncbi:MAG: hypothetical protein QOJ17_6429, partial [Rhodospirillaceae bacterium]|nr:hypothetical protein [Rhodospirillaceae bacterium]
MTTESDTTRRRALQIAAGVAAVPLLELA